MSHGSASRGLVAIARSPIILWAAFLLSQLWLGMLALYAPGLPLGDVINVYRFWISQGLSAEFWVGIDSAWVYPILALLPMLAAAVAGLDRYGPTWLTLVVILNAITFAFITGWGRARERTRVAWWWIAFLVLLGPIAVSRIDAVTVSLAIIGVLLLAARPRAAAVVLAIATWVKVWPAALLVAAVISVRARRKILIAAATVSVVVIGAMVALGGGAAMFSFVTQQTGRGLQVEAPVTTFWMWRALAGADDTFVYFDQDILTYQVHGPGVDVASAIMTPLLGLVVLVIAAIAVRAVRAGASPGDLFPALSLAFVTTLIAFNKVGSPQFISWLAVPVIVGLAAQVSGHGRSFRVPAVLVLVLAALTQLIYPYLYTALLFLDPLVVSVLSVRNVLEFVLLGWAIVAVISAPSAPTDPDASEWLPSVWPFANRELEAELGGEARPPIAARPPS
jgi:hypothetical protein